MGILGKSLFRQLPLLMGMLMLLGACATQYGHPIKKSSEFYDDLDWCERQADSEGYPHIGATRDTKIDGCMTEFGWRTKRGMCLSKYFGTRMPASERCE